MRFRIVKIADQAEVPGTSAIETEIGKLFFAQPLGVGIGCYTVAMSYDNSAEAVSTQRAGRRSAKQYHYTFGASSAIITNLALITALDASSSAKTGILGGLLVIAIADNLSDALGIHIHQETEFSKASEVWFSTFTNFSTRLLISAVFMVLVLLLPMRAAVIGSIAYGLSVLAIISFVVAREKKRNPYLLAFEHVAVAALVVVTSHHVGKWIVGIF
jgi:VIT1/CCC1 family predicted Fe2+/Mn2+ transporter